MKTRTGKNRNREPEGMGGLELIASSIHLVRTAPLSAIVAYYVGTVPFILGSLYFWTDMSKSAFAADRCFMFSLGLAALFIWMKCWHTVYASHLYYFSIGEKIPEWTPGRIGRLITTQVAIQSHGFWALPIAMVLLFPFHIAYGYFHNLTVFGDGTKMSLPSLSKKALHNANLWHRQNWILIWLLSPWILGLAMVMVFGVSRLILSTMPEYHQAEGFIWFLIALLLMINFLVPFCPFSGVVAGNIALIIVCVPFMLNSWFGIDTVFSLSGMHGIFNTTYLMTIIGLSFLCLDPFVKAGYVIRCFHGESLETGSDLMVELRDSGQESGGQK